MIQLKPKTWYYVYTDGENVFISEDTPSRINRTWFHPNGYKVNGPPFYIADPKSSQNISEFTKKLYVGNLLRTEA